MTNHAEPEPTPEWLIAMIDVMIAEQGNRVHEVLVEQMKINPGAIEALYG